MHWTQAVVRFIKRCVGTLERLGISDTHPEELRRQWNLFYDRERLSLRPPILMPPRTQSPRLLKGAYSLDYKRDLQNEEEINNP